MNYNEELAKNKLIDVCIKFIEICQKQILNGKVELKYYNKLVDLKFNFLNYLMPKEKILYINKQTRNRLNHINNKNKFIMNMINKENIAI